MSDCLGYLMAYTISTGSREPNLDVTRDQLEVWFDDLGISTTYLPGAIKTVDAFRSATTGRTREYVDQDGQRFRLVIEEIKAEPDLVVRWVMRQGLSPGTKSIKVAEIKFYRPRRKTGGRVAGTEDVKANLHKGLNDVELTVVQEFVDQCLQRYNSARRQIDPNRVRKIIRETLIRAGAVPVQPTNVIYYVPPDAHDVALAMREFIGRVGGKCKTMLVPLVDDPDQRELLREAIDSDVDVRARGVLDAIAKWRADEPLKAPSRLVMQGWVRECRGLTTLLERYGETYGMTFPVAAEGLETLQIAMHQLSGPFLAEMRR